MKDFQPTAPSSRRQGFSLVLSLVVMSMLLTLCLGTAALLGIELRVSQASTAYSRARLNAVVASRIALGELQRTLGPDQRVSATADLLCDPAQTDPSSPGYYIDNVNGRTVAHPRWTGVWNAGAIADTSVPGAAPGQGMRVLQRTTDGVLMDSRFTGGNDAWRKNRVSPVPGAASKRLVTWLVSGNEALPPGDTSALTPYTTPDDAKDVVLLGPGALGGKLPANRTESDMFGARARQVGVPTGDGSTSGSYAYWVADESVKARINLKDPYEAAGITPTSAPTSGGYAGLLIPQRAKVDIVRNPVGGGPALNPPAATSDWSRAGNAAQLALLSPADAALAGDIATYYRHDFTFDSAGVASDVVSGGLKKDLTAYFLKGDIVDDASAPGSGITGASPIIAAETIAPVSPHFALLKSWWNPDKSPRYEATDVVPVGPATFNKSYTLRNRAQGGNVAENLSMPVPDYANQSVATLAPVITQLTVYNKCIADNTGAFSKAWQARAQYFPQLVLWNPYAVPIRLSAAKVEYLNLWGTAPNYANPSSFTYVATRQHLTFTLPAGETLLPGQSVSYVADTEACRTSLGAPSTAGTDTPATAYSHRVVVLRRGLPDGAHYFCDPPIRDTGKSDLLDLGKSGNPPLGQILPISPTTIQRRLYFVTGTSEFPGNKGADFDDSRSPVSQAFLMNGDTLLQQVNLDAYDGNMGSVEGRGMLAKTGLSVSWPALQLLTSIQASPRTPDVKDFYGFRLKRLDETDVIKPSTLGPDATGSTARSVNFSPFADGNVRAPRQTRHPWDAADLIANAAIVYGGLWTNDFSRTLILPSSLTPPGADAWVPFYGAMKAESAQPACMPYDVAYRDVGVLSLGQLRHAPLNTFGYGPSMPFASGRIPMPGKGGGFDTGMTDRSGVTRAEANAAWLGIGKWGAASRRIDRQVRETDRIGNAVDLYDIAFELNEALWDRWFVSGIPAANPGWRSPSALFTQPAAGVAGAIPDATWLAQNKPARTAAYFSGTNYALYKAADGFLRRGAFNVNSTSVPAWTAMLSAFRGVRVPVRDNPAGVGDAARTPYSRHLRPKSGMVADSTGSTASFTENAWSGFRALSDEEVRLLAQKIVVEVKRRGPFLSLADFVNRRLTDPEADYANWTLAETDYLGTLEAAINAANLNRQFDDSLCDRETRERVTVRNNRSGLLQQVPRQPWHRSKHKVAGIPGYLEQGDLLQQLAPALTARSDTFKVRAMGEFGGAVAYVELTVQRTADPLVPATGAGDGGLPVNPRAVPSGTPYAGNQFFGRRLVVVGSRWLPTADI